MADTPDTPTPRAVKPLTRKRVRENERFLRVLEQTGNVDETVRRLGLVRSTYERRRRAHPAFAAKWAAALALAHAEVGSGFATPNGMRITRARSGRIQLRRRSRLDITPEALQRFLAALSATANIRLSAAAAGHLPHLFYRRARADPGFAREMRLALQTGYDRLEEALLAGTLAEGHEQDAWRHNEPPPVPPMTANQALQLLYLHQKEARLWGNHELLRRRRGETSEMYSMRLQLTAEMREARQRERDRAAHLAAQEGREVWDADDADRPVLPALEQVTGWSRASGDAAYDDTRALFGGWRIGDGEG